MIEFNEKLYAQFDYCCDERLQSKTALLNACEQIRLNWTKKKKKNRIIIEKFSRSVSNVKYKNSFRIRTDIQLYHSANTINLAFSFRFSFSMNVETFRPAVGELKSQNVQQIAYDRVVGMWHVLKCVMYFFTNRAAVVRSVINDDVSDFNGDEAKRSIGSFMAIRFVRFFEQFYNYFQSRRRLQSVFRG